MMSAAPAPEQNEKSVKAERRFSSWKPSSKSAKIDKPDEDHPQQKPKSSFWSKSFLSGICGTKSSVSKYEDREEYIRTTLCELAVYALYLTVTCMISYGLSTTTAYYYTNVVSHLFLDEPFGLEGSKTFRESTTVNDFWKFTETSMLNGLYWKYWYGIEEPGYELEADEAVLYENKLIGRPRLRQLRVLDEPCPISKKFDRLIRICYPKYSEAAEDKNRFSSTLGDQDAWKYHSEDELNETSHWGLLAIYSGAGAVQLLGTDKAETLQLLIVLKNNQWITRATRAVFLDFTLHNANVNLFCIVKLVWEFPTTGGVIPSWSIRTVKMSRYVSAYEYFLLVLEFVFIGFTIYYTLQEAFEISTIKWRAYWSDVWSYLDIAILIISYLCIVFSIYKHYLLNNYLGDLLNDPDRYVSFYWFGFWESQYTNTVAVLVFLIWMKSFKYISFNRTMMQLSTTMSRCSKDIGGFAIMFFIIFFAFAQLGHLLFGSTVEDFRTFHDTTFSLLRLILGDFDFRAIEAANRLLGPAYFITYVFFVFFVLMNMFLAIINDTYSEVKAEIQVHGAEFEITDYIKRGMNRFCGILGCGRSQQVDVEGQVRLANTENIITNHELRENFKNSNFSDVEIEMFLTKYELDEERHIDIDEAENVLGGLEGFHGPDAKTNEPTTHSDKPNQKKGETSLTDQEISELQTRMGVLESSLTSVGRKLDSLMEKLGSVNLKRQADSNEQKPTPF